MGLHVSEEDIKVTMKRNMLWIETTYNSFTTNLRGERLSHLSEDAEFREPKFLPIMQIEIVRVEMACPCL